MSNGFPILLELRKANPKPELALVGSLLPFCREILVGLSTTKKRGERILFPYFYRVLEVPAEF